MDRSEVQKLNGVLDRIFDDAVLVDDYCHGVGVVCATEKCVVHLRVNDFSAFVREVLTENDV